MIIDILVFIQGYVCLEVNVDLAFVTGILGCYNNDPVCSPYTINGSRGIFQNRNGFDVIKINVVELTFIGLHAVNHK